MADSHLHALTVIGVRRQSEEGSPLLMLEDELDRQLEIPIGLCEALAIQLATSGTPGGRPFTHDLLLMLAEQMGASVSRVVIDDYTKGTFYARLVLQTPDAPVTLDCRPSDGIAVAIRTRAPILATDEVMRVSGHAG